jgi:hypothetical protein
VDDGITAPLKVHKDQQDDVDTLGLSLDKVRVLLKFVLNNSYFRFGEDVYRQKTGEGLLPLFSCTNRQSMWMRYIDDVCVWSMAAWANKI